MKAKPCLALCLSLALASVAARAGSDDLQAFPPAIEGLQRQVIRLPAVEDEAAHKVELLIGKTLEVDCNRPRLSASLLEKTAKGWGYSYYVVEQLRGPMSTLMACPPGTDPERRFVPAYLGEHSLVPYNSRLPLVVYLPAQAELRYRIWRAGETLVLPE